VYRAAARAGSARRAIDGELRAAGVVVAPSNAHAAELAIRIVGTT